jgi:hypothetical protein
MTERKIINLEQKVTESEELARSLRNELAAADRLIARYRESIDGDPQCATARICSHEKLAHGAEVVIIGIGTVRLCDACRRILCTCGRCSAFVETRGEERVPLDSDDLDRCCADPTRCTYTSAEGWCRDGFRQARPWTLEEARRWLGLCKHCGAELSEGIEDNDCKGCAREGVLTEKQRAAITHTPDRDPFGGLLSPGFKAAVHPEGDGDVDGDVPAVNDAGEPVCPKCGYTQADCDLHGDHWRCDGPGPGGASDGDADGDVTTPVDDEGDGDGSP